MIITFLEKHNGIYKIQLFKHWDNYSNRGRKKSGIT